jgi:hypothetical protein
MSTKNDNVIGLEITEPVVVEKKKRGRKKQIPSTIETTSTTATQSLTNTENNIDPVKPIPKKRGRKPKGGKIVQETQDDEIITQINQPNIILHLRCSLNDIDESDNIMKYNPNIESIRSFVFDTSKTDNLLHEQLPDQIDDSHTSENNINENKIMIPNTIAHTVIDSDIPNSFIDNISSFKTATLNTNKHGDNMETIWDKLSSLKTNLHTNNISDKRSACFWCTYEFDNPPIFIPKHEFKNSYHVYGCFCSPECSVAHLMNEKIDSSVKFERYQLLNHIYGKIYNYEKNIKPAPDPHYLLDKFYGNLSIKEYRQLFKTEQLLIVVEKPLTHVFPELYEDNTDFVLNQRKIPSNSTIKLTRKSNPKKSSVLETLNSKNK